MTTMTADEVIARFRELDDEQQDKVRAAVNEPLVPADVLEEAFRRDAALESGEDPGMTREALMTKLRKRYA